MMGVRSGQGGLGGTVTICSLTIPNIQEGAFEIAAHHLLKPNFIKTIASAMVTTVRVEGSGTALQYLVEHKTFLPGRTTEKNFSRPAPRLTVVPTVENSFPTK